MSSGVGDDGSDVFRFEVLRGKKKRKQSCVLDRSAKRKKKRKKKKKEVDPRRQGFAHISHPNFADERV